MTSRDAPPSEIFLDTSILLARLKGLDMRAKVDQALRTFRWRGTAAYSKLEYGNVILSTVSYLLDKLDTLGNLEALRYHVANRLLGYQDKYKTWFSNLLAWHLNEPEATDRAKLELRYLLRIGTGYVDLVSDEVRDDIKCPWTEQTGIERWQRPSKCQKRRPGCRLPEFFTSNQLCFVKIRECIELLPETERTNQLTDFAQIIAEAVGNPQVLRDYEVCRRFADSIIAMESATYRAFFTQNIKESRVLCGVLGQLLLYLHQDPNEAIALHDLRGIRQQ